MNNGGKTEIGGGRPGMTTIAPTTDGKWLLTYEYWGGGTNVRYRIADDPLKFYAAGDAAITALPVPSGGRTLSTGGSPVLLPMPDGRIVYNASGSGNVWVNESGLSNGTWKEYQTTMPAGYSRNLQYVEGTGRVLILQAAWSGGSVGPVKYGEVDLGRSDGAYNTLVNRLTGQVLSPDTGKTQDANLTGNVPDLVLETRAAADDSQRWHLTAKGGNVTLLNKTGGRSVAIWTGTATAGQKLAQWVDDGATDKQWTLVASTDGYYKLRSVRNTSLFMTGATAGGSVTVAASTTDGSQDWQLVQDPLPTAASFTLKGANSGRCLDVPNGQTGVQVQIYDCSGQREPDHHADHRGRTPRLRQVPGRRTATAPPRAPSSSSGPATESPARSGGSVWTDPSSTAPTVSPSTSTAGRRPTDRRCSCGRLSATPPRSGAGVDAGPMRGGATGEYGGRPAGVATDRGARAGRLPQRPTVKRRPPADPPPARPSPAPRDAVRPSHPAPRRPAGRPPAPVCPGWTSPPTAGSRRARRCGWPSRPVKARRSVWTSKRTVACSPGARPTLAKPSRDRTGRVTWATGSTAYSWTVSAPGDRPRVPHPRADRELPVRRHLFAVDGPAASTSKVVYDSPWPKGNAGVGSRLDRKLCRSPSGGWR